MSLPFENNDSFTYGSYLMIPELLSLQQCVSVDPKTGTAEHDETLFIIIHQVYELWFKQVLHEIDHIVRLMESDNVNGARHSLKRVLSTRYGTGIRHRSFPPICLPPSLRPT